jgi:hypothetical protein
VSTVALIPVLTILIIVAIDLSVYLDAKRCSDEGSPVVGRLGTIVVETPLAWFVGCLVLWVIFFPLYIVSRAG